MSNQHAPALAPRSPFIGIVAVWVLAAIAAVLIGVLVPAADRFEWLCVALGGLLIVTFAVQIFIGRAQGFVLRLGASVLGSLVLLGLVSIGFGIAAMTGA